MAFDEGLAQRLREIFEYRADVEEKRMFGGLCFMVSGHMCCGIVGDNLLARVGPVNYEHCLDLDYASEMDFTGKAMRGLVYVAPAGIESDQDLERWVGYCSDFVASLPRRNV